MAMTKAGLRFMCPDAWEDSGNTFGALLIESSNSYAFDVDDEFVSEVSANEPVGASYQRVTLASLTTTWDAANNRWRLVCGAMDFGAIETGEDIAGVWFFLEGTDDTDSVLIDYTEFASAVATDGNSFVVTPTAEGVLRVA